VIVRLAPRPALAFVFWAASLGWAVALIVVPYLVARHPDRLALRPVAAAVYLTGGLVCHQRPERSFHPWGVQMPVCGRCFGLYAAAPLGAGLGLVAGVGWLGRRRPMTAREVRTLLVVTGLPTAATWSAEWLGLTAPSMMVRAAAALPLGAAVAWVIATAIREEIR